jgi:hypothetical protein
VTADAVYEARLARAREAMAAQGVDVLLLSVGADLPYFTGYTAMPLERLTMLVLPVDGPATMVIPRLEAPRVTERPDVFTLLPWGETEDPVAIVAGLAKGASVAAVGDHTWARFVVDLLGLLPDTAVVTYWAGNGHYKVERQPGGHHFQYTFSLNDPVTVDRWLAGCFQERYENVTEIRIRYPRIISNHLGFPHSPMDGGTIVPDPSPGP